MRLRCNFEIVRAGVVKCSACGRELKTHDQPSQVVAPCRRGAVHVRTEGTRRTIAVRSRTPLPEAGELKPPAEPFGVDVIIPYADGTPTRFLAESIESCLHQNYANTTVYAVRDIVPHADRPDTFPAWLRRHPRVKRFDTTERHGPYPIANALIDAHCTADWILIQDADDISLPNRAWRSVAMLQATAAAAVGGAMDQFIDRKCLEDEAMINRLKAVPTHRSGVVWEPSPHPHIIHGATVYRRASFCSIGGYADLFSGADCELTFRMQQAKYRVVVLDEVVALRRLVSSSLSHGDPMGSVHGPAAEQARELIRQQLGTHCIDTLRRTGRMRQDSRRVLLVPQ